MDSRDVIEGHLEALIAEGVLFSQPFERLVVADPEIHKMERSWRRFCGRRVRRTRTPSRNRTVYWTSRVPG